MKRRLIIIFIIAATALGIARIGLAYSINSVANGEKNLLADGNMEASGTGSWLLYGSATLSKQTTSPHSGKQLLRAAYNGFANPGATQNIFAPYYGKTVRVSGWMRSGNGACLADVEVDYPTVSATTANTTWTRFDFWAVPTAPYTNLYLYSNCSSAGQYVEFDDVQVTAYPGKIQNQEKNLLVDGNMEASGTTGWVAAGGATLSKNTSSPHSGTQALRITGNVGCEGYQNVTTGKKYKVTAWLRSTDGVAVPALFNFATVVWTGTTSQSWQRADVIFTATGVSVGAILQTANGAIEMDDIYVTAYPGKTQNTEKQIITDGNMEASGTGSWAVLRNAALTKTVAGQHSGKQALRVTNVTPDTNPAAYQQAPTTGKVYRLTGFARGDGANGIPKVSTQDAAADWAGTNSTSWQRFDITVKARAPYVILYNWSALTGWVEFDDVMVTLVP